MDNLNISELNAKHDEAMNLASLADFAKMPQEYDEANQKYRQAFELELDVAYTSITASRKRLV